jgi:hypothetical protein
MTELEELIANNISWLQTMKQRGGYSGPVVHYWRDSLNYIGPGLDWRYEGLITAFIALFKKTREDQFLDMAVECGDHLIKNQLPSGNFPNSNFESNPSLRGGATPHEPAACIGLLGLAKKLKELGKDWKPYFASARRNMDEYLLKVLWDGRKNTFFQYRYDRRTHVPNKIATITEFLLKLYDLTGEKRYFKYAIKNADFIISQQNLDEFYGGIYQSDDKNKIITFYVARCIPALIEIYKLTKDEKYLEASLTAGEFIKKMENKKGGFYFGFIKGEEGFKLYKYPVWIAGSGDIVRALLYLNEYERCNVGKNLNWIIENIDANGGVRTSYGMSHKNKLGEYTQKPSWRDVLHVVGWNDKSLRLFSELLEKDASITFDHELSAIEISCIDGTYYEDEKIIRIEGDEKHLFDKRSTYSKHDFLKKNLMKLGWAYTRIKKGEYGLERVLYSKLK